jgi:hypothetical protein
MVKLQEAEEDEDEDKNEVNKDNAFPRCLEHVLGATDAPVAAVRAKLWERSFVPCTAADSDLDFITRRSPLRRHDALC